MLEQKARVTIKERLLVALKEPLVHFLLAGLALFLFFALRGEEVDPSSRTITLTEQQVERLVASWSQNWQRTPTQPEIDGLIRDYVMEEVYYREGLRLGLDQDDTIIRRRIRSKMEFLARSELENATPSDKILQDWLDKNPQKYAVETRYSLDQIYFAAGKEILSAKALAQLKQGAGWQKLGEDISLAAQS